MSKRVLFTVGICLATIAAVERIAPLKRMVKGQQA